MCVCMCVRTKAHGGIVLLVNPNLFLMRQERNGRGSILFIIARQIIPCEPVVDGRDPPDQRWSLKTDRLWPIS